MLGKQACISGALSCLILRPHRAAYDTLPYYPEEITEMYLGVAMDNKDKDEIVARAKAVNPNIAIFQAKRDAKGAIAFDRI